MTTEATWYYVCDGCGSFVTITDAQIPEDEEWVCDDCGGAAMWEFTDKDAALRHSNHINALVRSGLMRRVGR